MPGTGIGDSGISISAISRGSLEPAAEGRTADTRKADALVAVTRHPKKNPSQSSGLRFPFELIPTANRQPLTAKTFYSLFPAAKSASESATHWRCSTASSGKIGMLSTSAESCSETGTLSKPRYF